MKMKIFDVFLYCTLTILLVICIYPFVYMINISISDSHEIANGTVYLIPKGIQFNAIEAVLKTKTIWRGYANSVLYAATGTLLSLILGTTAAYVLTVKGFKAGKYIMIFFTVTMFFNGGMIPTFLIIKKLGLLDTIWAIVILPSLSAWNIILFRTNFRGIPKALIDSARIDGANHFWIFGKVVIPLSKAIIATLGLFAVVAQWNSFFPALLYLTSQDKQPLMMVLRKLVITGNFRGEEMISGLKVGMNEMGFTRSIQMSVILISLGPTIFVYPFVQKYFAKGVLVGSIKG